MGLVVDPFEASEDRSLPQHPVGECERGAVVGHCPAKGTTVVRYTDFLPFPVTCKRGSDILSVASALLSPVESGESETQPGRWQLRGQISLELPVFLPQPPDFSLECGLRFDLLLGAEGLSRRALADGKSYRGNPGRQGPFQALPGADFMFFGKLREEVCVSSRFGHDSNGPASKSIFAKCIRLSGIPARVPKSMPARRLCQYDLYPFMAPALRCRFAERGC